MMKIALIGSTGFVGSAVLTELLRRHHRVTVLVRSSTPSARADVASVVADAYDVEAVAAAVRGHDAVVSAFNPGWNDAALYDDFIRGSDAIERSMSAPAVALPVPRSWPSAKCTSTRLSCLDMICVPARSTVEK